jgi:selenocysteine lyase/cysteine desulfurase
VICDYRTLAPLAKQGPLPLGLIRLSPHYFNTAAEIDRALELLAPLRAVAATA